MQISNDQSSELSVPEGTYVSETDPLTPLVDQVVDLQQMIRLLRNSNRESDDTTPLDDRLAELGPYIAPEIVSLLSSAGITTLEQIENLTNTQIRKLIDGQLNDKS